MKFSIAIACLLSMVVVANDEAVKYSLEEYSGKFKCKKVTETCSMFRKGDCCEGLRCEDLFNGTPACIDWPTSEFGFMQ